MVPALPRRILVAGALLASLVAGAARAESPAPVNSTQASVNAFAAASLTNAFQDIAKAYAATGNPPVRFSFAGSSVLARQMEAGAPASIFASADVKWMDYTDGKGLTLRETRVVPIGNALVLVAPADRAGPVTISRDMDLDALLGPRGRIVTGLTEAVPVGIYAKAALANLGLWQKAAPRIIGADSVRAALALVERGEAAYGIVYATDAAIARNVKVVATFPPDSHPPVEYPFALVKGQDTPQAKAFLAFLVSPQAKAIYERYGFTVK